MTTAAQKIEFFLNSLTDLSRKHAFTIDVGSGDKNCLRFYFKSGKYLTLKDVLTNKAKFRDIISGLEAMISKTGFILDSGDFSDGCPLVLRNAKTRAVLGYIEYDFEGEEEIIKYSFKKKI